MDKKELADRAEFAQSIVDTVGAMSIQAIDTLAMALLNKFDITPKAEKLFMGPDRRKGEERRVKDRRIGHDPSYGGHWRRNLGSDGRRSGNDRRQEKAEKQTPCPCSSELCCTYESQIKELKKELSDTLGMLHRTRTGHGAKISILEDRIKRINAIACTGETEL